MAGQPCHLVFITKDRCDIDFGRKARRVVAEKLRARHENKMAGRGIDLQIALREEHDPDDTARQIGGEIGHPSGWRDPVRLENVLGHTVAEHQHFR